MCFDPEHGEPCFRLHFRIILPVRVSLPEQFVLVVCRFLLGVTTSQLRETLLQVYRSFPGQVVHPAGLAHALADPLECPFQLEERRTISQRTVLGVANPPQARSCASGWPRACARRCTRTCPVHRLSSRGNVGAVSGWGTCDVVSLAPQAYQVSREALLEPVLRRLGGFQTHPPGSLPCMFEGERLARCDLIREIFQCLKLTR